MAMYNLIEYNDNYLKTSGLLWQYCRDVLAVVNDGAIIDFNGNNATTISFNLTRKITDKTSNNSTKDVEIMVPLRNLSNFWRTIEMPLINCEINLDLNWSENRVYSG